MTFFGTIIDFWNRIADAVVSGTTYTVAFFQNIGLAVAGALGHILIALIQPLVDVALILWFFLTGIASIITSVLSLPQYLYGFITTFVSSISLSSGVGIWSSDTLYFFSQIPAWSTVGIIVGAGLCFTLLYLVFRLLFA